jgi:hypothetical protein
VGCSQIDGTAVFTFRKNSLELGGTNSLLVVAIVQEEETEKRFNASARIPVTTSDYMLKLKPRTSAFHPKLPFLGNVSISRLYTVRLHGQTQTARAVLPPQTAIFWKCKFTIDNKT